MARSIVRKLDGKTLVEMPDEIAGTLSNTSELDASLEGGRIVLSAITAAKKITQGVSPLSDVEIGVLKKIAGVRYAERTKELIENSLNDYESRIYRQLFAKRVLYEPKLQKDRVGISNDYFELTKSKPSAISVAQVMQPAAPAAKAAKTPYARAPATKPADDALISPLIKSGFMILENALQAAEVTRRLKETNIGARGVRGFDKRFYVVTNARLDELEPKILAAVELPKTLKQLSAETKSDEDLVKACVEILKEDGKLVEKKKDLFVGA